MIREMRVEKMFLVAETDVVSYFFKLTRAVTACQQLVFVIEEE
jgi:hypothetical protein